MINPQNYAVQIEHILCDIFECERFGFGGIVNSDYIRRQPFSAIACGLSFVYATADLVKRRIIEKYIEEYSYYSKMSIDVLLSYTTSSKTIDKTTIEIGFDNGQQAIEKIIDDFDKIRK